MYVITVGYHSAGHLEALLNSLLQWSQVPLKILVWDNGASRAPVEAWQAHTPLPEGWSLQVLGTGKNLGFSTAINRCVETIRQENSNRRQAFLVINPDAELASVLSAEVIQELSTEFSLRGLRVYNDAGKTVRQASARSFPNIWATLAGREGLLTRFFPRNRLSQKYLGTTLDANRPARVDWVSGCAYVTDTDTWQRLGGYDESYFLYVEDVDLGRRARQKKIEVWYDPRVDIVHLIRGSADQRFWKADYHHHWGMWLYYVKWANPLAFLCGPIVFVAIWLRFLLRRVVRV